MTAGVPIYTFEGNMGGSVGFEVMIKGRTHEPRNKNGGGGRWLQVRKGERIKRNIKIGK